MESLSTVQIDCNRVADVSECLLGSEEMLEIFVCSWTTKAELKGGGGDTLL